MRCIVRLAGMAAIILSGPVHAQTKTSRCAEPEASSALVSYVREMVTATDSLSIARRKEDGLPDGAPERVALSLDPAVCLAAANAYNREARDTGARANARRVTVIRAGDRYVVDDPHTPAHAGEFTIWYIFDTRWRKITAYFS